MTTKYGTRCLAPLLQFFVEVYVKKGTVTMFRNQMAVLSSLLIALSTMSCRNPCENRAYISTNERSDFALIGVESECPFEVVLENELDNDIDRAMYPAGHAGFKLTVKHDEIQVVDLDQGEPVVNLYARPKGQFERVEKPPLITGIRDHRSTQWKIASINRSSEAGAVTFAVLVREPEP